MAEKSKNDESINDASNKSEKRDSEENKESEVKDDIDNSNTIPLKREPNISDEDTDQLQADSNSNQSSEFFLESIKEQYVNHRLTAKTLMYFIDVRDREKVSKWISKLDEMDDEVGRQERVYYIRYLVATLSGSFGLVEPFTSLPPDTVKELSQVLPAPVYAELLERGEDAEQSSRKPKERKTPAHERRTAAQHFDHDDKLFAVQQLFPPEGLTCYAAAFSALPDPSDR